MLWPQPAVVTTSSSLCCSKQHAQHQHGIYNLCQMEFCTRMRSQRPASLVKQSVAARCSGGALVVASPW